MMLKSVESASTGLNAASVDRIFATSDQATRLLVVGKSKVASQTLTKGIDADSLLPEGTSLQKIDSRLH